MVPVLGLWLSLNAGGCDDGTHVIELPSGSRSDPVQGGAGAGSGRVAVCDEAPTGTPCGKQGDRMHCVFDACVRIACGDGVMSEGEACDDGNERDHDGCSAYCRIETAPGCGNGLLEPGEACDDGNVDNDDRCTFECTNARCGDAIVSRGEECDDGNTSDGDDCTGACRTALSLCGNGMPDPGELCDDGNAMPADGCENDCTETDRCGNGALDEGEACDDGNASSGDGCQADCRLPSGGAGTGGAGEGGGAGMDGGAGTAGSAGESEDDAGSAGTGGEAGTGGVYSNPECEQCRQMQCDDYQGVDWVLGCFDATAAGDAARAVGEVTLTPAQVQSCVDAVACADPDPQNCLYDPIAPVTACYCGSGNTVDFCNNAANPVTGDCKEEWEALAGSTTRGDVMLSISDITLPSGWVYFLAECSRLRCLAECSN